MKSPGFCVCNKCKYYMPCMKGLDCSAMRCPLCGSRMEKTSYEPME